MTWKQRIAGMINRLLAPLGVQVCRGLPWSASLIETLNACPGYPYLKECEEGIRGGRFPIFVPYPVEARPRYGHGLPPHGGVRSILSANKDAYRTQLEQFLPLTDRLQQIPVTSEDDPESPCWSNPWFTGLDLVALYGFIALTRPRLYLEIGSGWSTKTARRAIADHGLATRITSIDPQPRAAIDHLADTVIRRRLEDVALDVFDSLQPGDILFFDGSHRCFMNSDVTVFFLEVLPRIPPGVLIHIHDIHMPSDYPPCRALHYESEQYVLAAMLLHGMTRFDVVLPNRFVLDDNGLRDILRPLWDIVGECVGRKGTSFWMRKRADGPGPSGADATRGGHTTQERH